MTDYDATAHITEEMKNPAVKAPVAILAALGTTYVLGFGLNIALSVCMGSSWPDLLSTPTGLPVAQLLYNVLGRRGGVAFVSLAAAICNFTGASCLQAQARTAFALSRGHHLDVFNCRRDVAFFKVSAPHLEQDTDSRYRSVGQCSLLRLSRFDRFGFVHCYLCHFQRISLLRIVLTDRSPQLPWTGAVVFQYCVRYTTRTSTDPRLSGLRISHLGQSILAGRLGT
jgi:hypothetical protein